ncbi:putative class-I aminoacyl-tRNA synthetase family protein [Lyophyllum shimeji]|uniref:Probable methionine--tRNA ligase, mitochondrial n=1 Tax=Lyophyllum shimeji TaxID=47721 RepID=A0A9P3UIG9_LYOSH|nr:putative class-I aminoacyl-tRNA synthetase family protein [Lyophyllum shimeji]
MLLRCLPRRLQRCPAKFQYHSTVLWRGIATESKPYYITTPIFYPNAVPHIGHLYTLVIADILARYRRLLEPNRPVQFLAGTDEHGLKIQKAAQAKCLPTNEFCDQLSTQFRRLADKAQISNTVFMRTSDRVHHAAVESVWNALNAKNLIYKADYSGWYSITDECFYTPGQVTTSPIDPSVTISAETGSVVEWQAEQNYMFRLSSFRDSLLAHYTSDAGKKALFPPQHQAHVVKILTEEPLEDLSVSRPRSRLSWGVPVPNDPEHTIYVWFDALLVYLSGIGYPWGEKGKGWPVDLQIIGKDIIRFHAIYLPAILQALELPLQHRLLAHAHWTVEQKKMSKSVGNVADPFEAMDEFGVDVVRFYLARVGGRFRDDTDWSREQLEKHDREIQSLLGNLLLRVTSPKIAARASGVQHRSLQSVFAEQKIDGPTNERGRALVSLMEAMVSAPKTVRTQMDDLEVGEALDQVMQLLKTANKTFTDVAPWKKSTTPEEAYACCLATLEVLRVTGVCLQPFMPGVAGRLLDALGVPEGERTWADVEGEKSLVWKGTALLVLSSVTIMDLRFQSLAASEHHRRSRLPTLAPSLPPRLVQEFAVFGASGVERPFPRWAGNPATGNVDYCNGNGALD